MSYGSSYERYLRQCVALVCSTCSSEQTVALLKTGKYAGKIASVKTSETHTPLQINTETLRIALGVLGANIFTAEILDHNPELFFAVLGLFAPSYPETSMRVVILADEAEALRLRNTQHSRHAEATHPFTIGTLVDAMNFALQH